MSELTTGDLLHLKIMLQGQLTVAKNESGVIVGCWYHPLYNDGRIAREYEARYKVEISSSQVNRWRRKWFGDLISKENQALLPAKAEPVAIVPLVDRYHDCLEFMFQVLQRLDLHDIDAKLRYASERRYKGNQDKLGKALFSMPLLCRKVGDRDLPAGWKERFTDNQRPLVIALLEELAKMGITE